MNWDKYDFVWKAESFSNGEYRGAFAPTPIYDAENNRLFVYVTCVDSKYRGLPFCLELEPSDPRKIIEINGPLLAHSGDGKFDSDGIMITSILKTEKGYLFYYTGFARNEDPPYVLSTGLAVSESLSTPMRRFSDKPVLQLSEEGTVVRSGLFVTKVGGQIVGWYAAGNDWKIINGNKSPRYDIFRIESKDGYEFGNQGERVLAAEDLVDCYAIGRPWVVVDEVAESFKMYLSKRRESLGKYRVGSALSKNGYDWIETTDEDELDVSENGFDNDVICYTSVIHVRRKKYIFFNGNGLGLTGFGIGIETKC